MNVEKINVNDVELDICDRQARDAIGGVNTRVNTVEQGIVDVNASIDEIEGSVNGRIDVISGSVDVVGGEVDRVKKSVGYTINLLPNNVVSQSINGLDIVVNEDKSFTVNGTATAQTDIHIFGKHAEEHLRIYGLEVADYIFKGCAEGGNANTYMMYLTATKGSKTVITDKGSGNTFTHDKDAKYACYLRFKANKTYDNLTFKPMICKAEDSECEYVPYFECDRDKCSKLERNVAFLQSSVGFSKKNLLEHHLTTQTVNGITYTVDTYNRISVSGTATADSYIRVDLTTGTNSLYKGKKYVLSGIEDDAYNAGISSYLINADVNFKVEDCGYGVEFEYPYVSTLFYVIFVKSGTTLSSTYMISPMIRFADIDDTSYESFVPSIQQTVSKVGDYNTITEYNKSLSKLSSYSTTIYKKNGWVFFSLDMKPATNNSTGYLYKMCTFDAALRPKSAMKFIDKFYVDGNEYGCELSIATDGSVEYRLLNNVDTTKYFYFRICYPSLI